MAMPLHDLKCRACRSIERDVYIPLLQLLEPDYSQGYKRTSVLGPLPRCQALVPTGFGVAACQASMEILPPRVGVDLYESGATTVWVPDGHGGQVERSIKSLRDIRKVEAETAALGQPHIWRDYNQDRSNRDKHTIMDDPSGVLSPEARSKFGPGIRRSMDEPVAALGEGVTEDSSTQFGDR